MMNRWKIPPDVQSQAVVIATQPLQILQHGPMRSAANSPGVGVFDKATLVMRANLVEQGTVHNTIADRRRRNEACLGVVNDAQAPWLRLVAVGDKGALQGAEMTISVEIECGHARPGRP